MEKEPEPSAVAAAAVAMTTLQKKRASSSANNNTATRSPAIAKKLPLQNKKNMASAAAAAASSPAAVSAITRTPAAAAAAAAATATSKTLPLPVVAAAIDNAWMREYESLMQFKKATSHVDVPDDGTALSRWVLEQNRDYAAFIDLLEGRSRSSSNNSTPPRMNEGKLKMLRELGFIFQRPLKSQKVRWEAKVALLLEHKKKHPRLNVNNVPYNDKYLLNDQERIQFRGLGAWVRAMRTKIRQSVTTTKTAGRTETAVDDPFMTSERITRLLDIGLVAAEASWRGGGGGGGNKRKNPPPSNENDKTVAATASTDDDEAQPPAIKKKRVWTPATIEAREKERETKWELMYQQMQVFVKENGHAIVPTKNVAMRPLRCWLNDQRAEYKALQAGEASRLTAVKLQRLTDIGFVFHAKKCFTFEERLQQWVEFREQNNGKDPERYSSDGLGKWMSSMREKYYKLNEGKRTSLTREQADRMTALQFRWSIIKRPCQRADRQSWDERFEQLKLYLKEFQNTPPQNSPGLGSWCHCQRKMYQQLVNGEKNTKNTMSAEQIAKLNSLVGWHWTSRPRGNTRGGNNRNGARLKRGDDDDDDDDKDSDSTDDDGNDE